MRHLRLEVIIKKILLLSEKKYCLNLTRRDLFLAAFVLKCAWFLRHYLVSPRVRTTFLSWWYDLLLVMVRFFSRDKKDRVRLFVFESLSSVGAIGQIVAKVAKRSIFYSCWWASFFYSSLWASLTRGFSARLLKHTAIHYKAEVGKAADAG